jgi:hypothetical protein
MIVPLVRGADDLMHGLYAFGVLKGQQLIDGCCSQKILQHLPHQPPVLAVRQEQNMSVVAEDQIIGNVVRRPAGVDSASAIEQSSHDLGESLCDDDVLTTAQHLLKNMFVVIKHYNILWSDFQPDD